MYGVAKSAAYGGRLSVPADGCAADLHQPYRSPFTGAGVRGVGWSLGDGRGSDVVLLSRKTA